MFNFDSVNFNSFLKLCPDFLCPKKYVCISRYWKYYSMFSSGNFIVLDFMVGSEIHLKSNFIYEVKHETRFFPLISWSCYPSTIYWKDIFPHWNNLESSLKLHNEGINIFWTLTYSIDIFLCQKQTLFLAFL